MHLKFTKEVILISSNKGLGNLENSKSYKVFKESALLGYFYITRSESYFAFEDRKFRVESKRSLIRKSRHFIFDHQTNSKVGEYKISEWVHGLTPIGDLIVDGQIYTCKRNNSTSNYQQSISVGNNEEGVLYSFAIDMPRITFGDKSERDFEGAITTSNSNLFLVFAGLFLLEHSLVIEDSI